MAEFAEVMRQAKRMCKSYGVECGPCKLHENYGLCPLCAQVDDHIPAEWTLDKMPEIERIVMDWAAKNPEPRYPSWREWHEANFPEASSLIQPCRFMNQDKAGCGVHLSCDVCRANPIPADIAEKLGIKPIGGGAG